MTSTDPTSDPRSVAATLAAAKTNAAGRSRPAAPTVGIPSAPPLPPDLEALLRGLRLPHIRRHAPEVLATAKAQRWDPAEVLKALLVEEAAGRARSALATRRTAAAFPTGKTFDAWQPEISSIPAPTQQALRTLEWVHRRENLVVCGPSGTGKTFLLEALGQQAVEEGLKVAWFTLEDLGVLRDVEVAADGILPAAAYLRVDGPLTLLGREATVDVVAGSEVWLDDDVVEVYPVSGPPETYRDSGTTSWRVAPETGVAAFAVRAATRSGPETTQPRG